MEELVAKSRARVPKRARAFGWLLANAWFIPVHRAWWRIAFAVVEEEHLSRVKHDAQFSATSDVQLAWSLLRYAKQLEEVRFGWQTAVPVLPAWPKAVCARRPARYPWG